MSACARFRKRLDDLAALPPDRVPPVLQEHLTACAACRRKLAAARLSRRFLAAAGGEVEPPPGFPERVAAAIPRGLETSRGEAEVWRLGWGLVPTFAAMTLALFLMYQTTAVPGPAGLVNTETLSASERLVLEQSSSGPDQVLAAVLEGGQQ